MLPYRRFAAITVVIALIAAVFISPDSGPVTPATLAAAPASDLPKVTIRKRSALPVAGPAPADVAADAGEDEELAVADEAQAEPSALPLDPDSKKTQAKAADTHPTPDQIDRLVDASRERSGGVDQGDEPRRGGA